MDVEKLYAMLEKTQTAQGYFFNADRERTMELLEALLKNKDRYGYMVCPCRLSSGDRENDKDIICPCVYRAPDVEKYGSCYCNLYVSKAWNDGTIDRDFVPERRPPEKIMF
ncbi:MAG: ferredoxin:thioredoxin reductase [Desulfobacteraceae bacterium]|nr:ferredoxin:thioredoxin reductase [Desulfobacteraceae bacterium]MBC2751126.1 ferredoxin:thioredoxin reductase [Desulfobacteraceae bacterium]